MTTTVSPLVPMLSDKLDNVIHQHHHQLRHQQATAPPARLNLSHRQVIPSSSSSATATEAAAAATATTTAETPQQQARHPGQRTGSASSSSASASSSTANLSASSTSVDYLQQQQQQSHHQHQHQQHLDHHPASTTSALNGFYQAIQQRHNSSSSSLGDLTGKDQVESSNNPTAISLFSPWSNFTGAGISANNYPFPSPSLGFTLGDTFVPWTDAMVPSGLTPTLNGTMMDQQHGMQSQSHHHHAGGGGAGFRDDNHHSQFFKQEYMGNAGMTFGLPMDDHDHSRRQGSLGGGDLRKESNASSLAAAGNNNNNNHGPGSVSRVDSSSSGASMASAQMDGNVRTPTPLFKGNNTNDSVAGGSAGGGGGAGAGGSSFGEPASGSYFTYPRPGGGAGDSNLLSSSAFQSGSAGVGEGSSRAPMQPQQLFHLNQPFQPAFTMQHNNNNHHHQQQQYMSVPPTLTQHPPHQHQQQQQLHHHLSSHGNGFLQTDRQNSRASTSSEFSSISPAMLNSRAPRASSPVSMFSDDALHPISAQTSPHSQPQNLPIHPGMQHVGLKRGSASSMMTDADDLDGDDLDGDEADGVEKNGMMWGMPTAAYRSLSARERKRVRNRISARTFRARRKEHLSVLEQDLSDRNALLKASQDEIKQLRNENAELRRRLMLCENEHH